MGMQMEAAVFANALKATAVMHMPEKSCVCASVLKGLSSEPKLAASSHMLSH